MVSLQSILQERKFPFLSVILTLIALVTVVLLSNDSIGLFPHSISDLRRWSSISYDAAPSVPPPIPSSFASVQPNHAVPSDETPPPSKDNEEEKAWLEITNTSLNVNWERCNEGPDYIPCLDNMKAIKSLKSRKHMEHRERLCPKPNPRCLVPLPRGYKIPVQWPKSRDMIWYDNSPHIKLVEYKKDQNWVRKAGDFLVFPGGGTQFKAGVVHYINFIQKSQPLIDWGKSIRVVLDVGCGVASFGGYLLDRNVITMSFAPKDEHEAQIQFALERGIPATLAVIATKKLPFPSNAYDVVHCARCRVHWHGDGGKPLLELNRILRPGGFFIWSATPVYKHDEKHQDIWNTMVSLTTSMCWKLVSRARFWRVGFVIYQKPDSTSCYEKRKETNPPPCDEEEKKNSSWYVPLKNCLARIPADRKGNLIKWPSPWPERLNLKPVSISTEGVEEEGAFHEDAKRWSGVVSSVYADGLGINWTRVRNVMDMNAGYGGFASALINRRLWVMNVIPIDVEDTLSLIYDRGLIGLYHDWCEPFNTYPRSYDLLHSSFLFGNLSQRCDVLDVVVEMDRMVRPGGYIVVQDTIEVFKKLNPILVSLHWSTQLYRGQFLVGEKSFWRPQ